MIRTICSTATQRSRSSLAFGQYRPRLLPVDKSVRNDTANPVRQRPLRSFCASLTAILQGQPVGAGALIQPPQPNAAAKSP